MNQRRLLTFLAGLGILILLLVVNHWIFENWLNTPYLKWYLESGSLVAVVSTVTSLTWGDINRHSGLISAHPLNYLGACLQLVGLPIYSLGTHLKASRSQQEAHSLFDLLLTIPCLLILVITLILWLLVIAPPQYFVYLICGAPARTFSRSALQPIAQLKGSKLEIREFEKEKELPTGWWSASLSPSVTS